MRILKRLVAIVGMLVVACLATACLAGYLAATGRSLPILRAITTQLGHLLAAQRTEHLELHVHVIPDQGRLVGRATLTLRSLEDGRQRFYFLLNDGLHIRNVRIAGAAPDSSAVSAYQLWLLTVVTLRTPVGRDATIRLGFDYDGVFDPSLLGVDANIINGNEVLLNVDSFWYPSDVQGFFTTDVTLTLPRRMTVVHNGAHATRVERGNVQEVHWTTERPIGGLSLVAGTYALTTAKAGGTAYQLYLPLDLSLDSSRVLELMADANELFGARFGPSGFTQITMFVSRDLRRGYNDGSGLMGLSSRYFRSGDYGFATIAHEIAHNWWGGTVAEKWLSPKTGGEWIVEGFAEFSSLLAAEATFGSTALTQRLAGEFFDPARQAVVADMSVLDNALNEARARDTIYHKGAYVAFMLRKVLGDDVYFRGLRRFIERFRYQQATASDLQQVLQKVSEQNLDAYFGDWVRSDRLADLSLDATNGAEVAISNLGTAAISSDIDLWTFKKTGGEPLRTTVHVGDRVPLDPDVDYAVLDPLLQWADVQRENNRYPRRNDPVYVSTSSRGAIALTGGEAFPWVRAAVTTLQDGRTQHTWDFNRGLSEPPTWSPDGMQLLVSEAAAETILPTIVALAPDGAQHTIGYGTAPVAAPDGTVYAVAGSRLMRFDVQRPRSILVEHRGAVLDAPVPSPDGSQIAYTAARGNALELRAIQSDGRNDRFLLGWDRDRVVDRWSADGSRLYAIVGGSWDWRIWEVPLGDGPVHVLASGAAAITDLALSPDGARLAFTAAPRLDYPTNRRQLYVLNLTDQSVRTIDVPAADASYLAWQDNDTVLVVARTADAQHPWMLPAQRTVKRVRLADGSVEDIR